MSDNVIKSINPLDFTWATADPFLFCVYHRDYYPEGNEKMGPKAALNGRNIGMDFQIKDGWRMYHGNTVPGFPAHPHRGFETVTLVTQGLVDHADSIGAEGRYGNGDTQWLTTGKGVQHSEMFPLLNKERANDLELFQIWLNLPKANKMVDPYFTMLWSEAIPEVVLSDSDGNKITINVIAGSIDDAKPLPPPPDSWAADPDNHLAIWTIKMDAGAKWSLPAAVSGLNRKLYFYQGSKMKMDGSKVDVQHGVALQSDKELLLENGDEESSMLLLQGRPINEPVAHHGPFVMNTQKELQQAFTDYHRTSFGGWPWPKHDHVHPRDKGRFAKHANGHEEIKEEKN
jgi:quercetin 2,3-dioxygenase